MNWSMIRIGRTALLVSAVVLAGSNSVVSAAPTEESKTPVAKEQVAKAPLSRADVGKLLVQARQAMAKGKLPDAEALLAQAEAAKLKYPVLHFGDTPAKVRRDLAKLTGKSAAGNKGKNAESLSGTRYAAAQKSGSKQDPFKKQPAGTESAPVVKPTILPAQHVAAPQLTNPAQQGTIQQAIAMQPSSTPQPKQVQPASSIDAKPIDLSLPSVTSPAQKEVRLAQAPVGRLTPLPAAEELIPGQEDAFQLLQGGETALRQGDRNAALEMFRSAYARRNELDIVSQQRLQDHLQMLTPGSGAASPSRESGSLLNDASSGQAVLARQMSAEIGKQQAEAARLRTTDPQGALTMLKDAGERISKSELDEGMKRQLIRRLDLSIVETERFIRDYGAEIELERANQAVLEDIDRQREVKLQVQKRLAELVEQFNTLRNEQRYAEMEIVANRAVEMAPDEPVAQQIWENARFIRRTILNQDIAKMTEEGVFNGFADVRQSAGEALRDMQSPMSYGTNWGDLVKGRAGSSDGRSRRTAKELEIQQKLRTQILPNYNNAALADVVESLSELTGVNIYLDPRGLGQEGVRSDTPVNLDLGQEISLESALNLILEPLHLTYMIKNEVLKVTSEQLRDGDLTVEVYNVADLVVPIPNFVPSNNMGLQGLINDAYEALPNVRRGGSGPVTYVPGQMPVDAGVPANPNVLQQPLGSGAPSAGAAPLSAGPGGLGGAAAADFDSLIDLIVSTVEHESWMENGTGDGEIQPFPTNLSLVISQTQRVHEQIADLLEQLRRLQDLQVTIEVRFIRLTDNFFERIGIDFDFNIEDGGGSQPWPT